MAYATRKITLATACDIPFNKLVLSQANVRKIKAGVSIEELAEDIASGSFEQPQCSPRTRRQRQRDRPLPHPGRRPPLPGAGTARVAEASVEDIGHPLRDQPWRDTGGRGLACGERPSRQPASARSARMTDPCRFLIAFSAFNSFAIRSNASSSVSLFISSLPMNFVE